MHNVFKAERNFDSPGIKPILPATGSTIIAARSSPILLATRDTASISLYGQLYVNAASSFGIPGESGKPNVETPEPALTNNESTCP